MSDYTCFVVGHYAVMRPTIVIFLNLLNQGVNTVLIDGTNIGSFSKIMNRCITQSNTEKIIVCSYRVIDVDARAIERVAELLDQGYGLASICSLRLMGYKKDLIRKVGFWDERFIGGGCEDGDFTRRIKHADIAIFEDYEVTRFLHNDSSWKNHQSNGQQFFYEKYKYIDKQAVKVLPETTYYDIGEYQLTNFLPFEQSHFGNNIATKEVLSDVLIHDKRWVDV